MKVAIGADKPVLILGGTSDIAHALAHVFAGEGHPIYLTAREPARLEILRSDLEIRYDVEVNLLFFDVHDIDRHRHFIEDINPKPHIVISAIGLMGDQERSENDVRAAELIMRTNYLDLSLAIEVFAEMLVKIDAPTAIIGISSVAGERGRAKNYYYGSAKAGFTQFLSGLRQKLSSTRVHVMTVKPGFVKTKATAGMNLPGIMTTTSEKLAARIKSKLAAGHLIVYSPKWFFVMAVIKIIPEPIYQKLKF